jgi:hypothetical protein
LAPRNAPICHDAAGTGSNCCASMCVGRGAAIASAVSADARSALPRRRRAPSAPPGRLHAVPGPTLVDGGNGARYLRWWSNGAEAHAQTRAE